MDKNKEQIYDEQINPLMAQIISLCKLHKIAMLCSFSIPTEYEPSLMCTTALLAKSYNPPSELTDAFDVIMGKETTFMALTVTKQEG